jgi:Arc/MetJ family transcription regulator
MVVSAVPEGVRLVSRTILDVDDELLAEAAKIFGTTTKKATVNAALAAAVKREKRREFADWLKGGGLPDLTGSADEAQPSGT